MALVNMLKSHPFWGILTLAVLAWYCTVTIHVAVRGAFDIKEMLRRLKSSDQTNG
jgi:hypothetical protein